MNYDSLATYITEIMLYERILASCNYRNDSLAKDLLRKYLMKHCCFQLRTAKGL